MMVFQPGYDHSVHQHIISVKCLLPRSKTNQTLTHTHTYAQVRRKSDKGTAVVRRLQKISISRLNYKRMEENVPAPLPEQARAKRMGHAWAFFHFPFSVLFCVFDLLHAVRRKLIQSSVEAFCANDWCWRVRAALRCHPFKRSAPSRASRPLLPNLQKKKKKQPAQFISFKKSDWNSKPHKALSMPGRARTQGIDEGMPHPTGCVGIMRRMNYSNCPYAKRERAKTKWMSDWLSIQLHVCVCSERECNFSYQISADLLFAFDIRPTRINDVQLLLMMCWLSSDCSMRNMSSTLQ